MCAKGHHGYIFVGLKMSKRHIILSKLAASYMQRDGAWCNMMRKESGAKGQDLRERSGMMPCLYTKAGSVNFSRKLGGRETRKCLKMSSMH